MQATLAMLQTWLPGAELRHAAAETKFSGVTTDSRNVAAGNVFVALRGEHFDAHDFLSDVAARDVAAVVVQALPADLHVAALVVPDTRAALGQIAAGWRRRFSLPVIGVTGSNGKTTVKEMIASILAAAFGEAHSLATRGNLNNDIGVPLTVMRMDAAHHAAVIELGMNHPGEIAMLAAIARPTVALVNNAQREHLEFMQNVEAVARENGAVILALPAGGTAVFPAEDAYAPMWRKYAQQTDDGAPCQRQVMTFGLSEAADVRGSFVAHAFGSDLEVRAGQLQFAVRLSAAGTHNVLNALAATACCLAVGISPTHIVQGLESFSPVKGRLQRKVAANGAVLIDDTYNANPDSVRAAIDVLAQAGSGRILVLGDMGEVGDEGRQFHEEIGSYARQKGIENLLTLGELASHAATAFGAGAQHCTELGELATALDAVLAPQHTVLVKGSRFMKMERVVQHLAGMHNNNEQTREAH